MPCFSLFQVVHLFVYVSFTCHPLTCFLSRLLRIENTSCAGVEMGIQKLGVADGKSGVFPQIDGHSPDKRGRLRRRYWLVGPIRKVAARWRRYTNPGRQRRRFAPAVLPCGGGAGGSFSRRPREFPPPGRESEAFRGSQVHNPLRLLRGPR